MAGAVAQRSRTLTNAPERTDSEALPVNKNDTFASSTRRESEWVELLRRRPRTSDTEAISKWLFDVMSVSELPEERPLDDPRTSSNVNNPDEGETSANVEDARRRRLTVMTDRKAKRAIIDKLNDSKRLNADEKMSSSSESESSTTSITSKERQSSKIQKKHDDEQLIDEEEKRPSRAKKRKL